MSLFYHNPDDDTYQLLNKRGKLVNGVIWESEPQILSGVFLICKNKLYTVLGEPVGDFNADYILNIINFWVYYIRDGISYIARLEPMGLKFKAKAETPVQDVGYLSYDGCVVMQNGEWVIYNYSFGTLIEDKTIPDVDITSDVVVTLLQKGFTTSYLTYLSQNNGDELLQQTLMLYDTNDIWRQTNIDFIKMLKKLSELTETYTVEQIGNVIGLKSYVVSVIMQYLEIKDFLDT